MSAVSSAAYDYLRAGLEIIALTGKAPNSAFHRHGLQDALSGKPDSVDDLTLIEQVFTHEKTTGVGIVISAPYVVVDIDGEDGARELADILGTTDLDHTTPVAKTARGLHIWYSDWTEHRTTKLGTRLDLKGVGGYVAAPPSRHPDGATYRWITPMIREDGTLQPVMEMPDLLREELGARQRLADHFSVEPREKQRILRLVNGKLSIGYEAASIVGLVNYVRDLPEGNRNAGLFWAASTAKDDGFPQAEALPLLLEAAISAGLDAQEARTAIRSAYRRSR